MRFSKTNVDPLGRILSRTYSRIDSAGRRSTTRRLGSTSVMVAPTGAWPRRRGRSPAFTSQSKVRRPLRASCTASAAATVLFPTPPLPVTTKRRLWSSEPGMKEGRAGP